MLVEWDWHNYFYENGKLTSHSESVNFDMGLGTGSTRDGCQIAGYIIETLVPYIQHAIETSPSGGGVPYWDPRFRLK